MLDRIKNSLERGRNIFITGSAGTGKSYTLEKVVEWLKDEQRKSVMKTATTGIAAINIEGITAHRFFGSGIANSVAELGQIVRGFPFKSAAKAMQEHDVVVIDEVSMITTDVFELWDKLAQIARNSDEPFGGLQVILSGDFMQLPPVIRSRYMESKDWVFNSETWKELNLDNVMLEKIHRQGDELFIHHLARIRLGFHNEETNRFIESLDRLPAEDATWIVPTNNEATAINISKLAKIDEKETVFTAILSGDKKLATKLAKDLPVDEIIQVKVGAEVLICVNASDGTYANGTKGTIEKINSSDKTLLIRKEDGKLITIGPNKWDYKTLTGKVKASVTQYPIKLAWAITAHKSQGMTISKVHIVCDNIFENAQFYVAISRAKGLEGLSVANYNPQKTIRVNLDAREYYRKR